MNRLISADIMKMLKSKILWICMIGMFCCGMIAIFSNGKTAHFEKVFYKFTTYIGIAMAVFCSMFIETDYSDKTIRNKLIIGHKRVNIYLVNFFVSVCVGILFVVMYLIPIFLFGVEKFGWFYNKSAENMKLILVCMFSMIAFAAIFTMISMLISAKAVCEILCLLCVVAISFLGLYLRGKLGEPELCMNYSYDDTGKESLDYVPNPYYIKGTQRDLYEFVLDFTPSGQCIQVKHSKDMNSERCIFYSFIIITFTTGLGLMVFQKKNIN